MTLNGSHALIPYMLGGQALSITMHRFCGADSSYVSSPQMIFKRSPHTTQHGKKCPQEALSHKDTKTTDNVDTDPTLHQTQS